MGPVFQARSVGRRSLRLWSTSARLFPPLRLTSLPPWRQYAPASKPMELDTRRSSAVRQDNARAPGSSRMRAAYIAPLGELALLPSREARACCPGASKLSVTPISTAVGDLRSIDAVMFGTRLSLQSVPSRQPCVLPAPPSRLLARHQHSSQQCRAQRQDQARRNASRQ